VTGGTKGIYSRFYPCGYSADMAGGCGNLDGSGSPFCNCTGTQSDCAARGMWQKDVHGQATARFGGFQFLPSTSLVRSSGSSQRFWSQAVDGRAKTNDAVPLVYGTVRYPTPVIWAWNDGNFLICEALVGSGPIQGISRLWVNGIELPLGVQGTDMSATGWYDVLTTGARNGTFDPNFTDSQGNPVSDPHGSLAVVSVHVPTGLISSNSLPTIEVLAQGLVLQQYDERGKPLAPFFTSNPAWALLDMLKRCGWQDNELDIPSFANTAILLSQAVPVSAGNDPTAVEPRATFNFALLDRKPAIDIIRGLRQGAELLLRLNEQGQINVIVEGTVSNQQSVQMIHSNATSQLNGGWPSFEANDGATGDCTILANKQGDIDLRLFCQPTSQTPNRLTVEYQDSRNDYANGSLSLVDLDDVARAGSEIPGICRALGIPSQSQAQRVLSKEIARCVDGNLFAEFSTTVKGLGMQPGDIITLTSGDYELVRAPFRVLRLSAGLNFETVTVLAQTHDDGWYGPGTAVSSSSTGWPSAVNSGTPLPIAGYTYSAEIRPPVRDSGVVSFSRRWRRERVAGGAVPSAKTTGRSVARAGDQSASRNHNGRNAQAWFKSSVLRGNSGRQRRSGITDLASCASATGAMESSFGVTINGLNAPAGAAGLRVYRGESAFDLLYLADIAASLTSWTDEGGDVSPMRPPDPRYDHADFYWREELTAQLTIESLSNDTIVVPDGNYRTDQFAGSALTVVTGSARYWQTTVAANTSTTFRTADPFPSGLAVGDTIAIADSSWRLAGRSYSDQITWEAPNRAGLSIEIIGRSCTANGMEAPAEQSFLNRYTLIGGSGSLMDSRVPPKPSSIIEAPADGTILLRSITTETLTGTNTVSDAILVTYSNDETSTVTSFSLVTPLAANDSTLPASEVLSLTQSTYLQVDSEIICVNELTADGLARWIDRGVARLDGSRPFVRSYVRHPRKESTHSAIGCGILCQPNTHRIPVPIPFPESPGGRGRVVPLKRERHWARTECQLPQQRSEWVAHLRRRNADSAGIRCAFR
jgi:hypothetical protein